jgi:hypothetical protein
MEEGREFAAEYQDGPTLIDGFESGAEPGADRVLVYFGDHRSLAHGVVPVELHAPRI